MGRMKDVILSFGQLCTDAARHVPTSKPSKPKRRSDKPSKLLKNLELRKLRT